MSKLDSNTREYRAWWAMHQRCRNPKCRSYADYGGRGIKVCRRWAVFANFAADMGARPSAKHSLERINNSRGYSPSNCRWATRKEQQRNRRCARWVRYRGKRWFLPDLARAAGMYPQLLRNRIDRGWGVTRAVTEPVNAKGGRRG